MSILLTTMKSPSWHTTFKSPAWFTHLLTILLLLLALTTAYLAFFLYKYFLSTVTASDLFDTPTTSRPSTMENNNNNNDSYNDHLETAETEHTPLLFHQNRGAGNRRLPSSWLTGRESFRSHVKGRSLSEGADLEAGLGSGSRDGLGRGEDDDYDDDALVIEEVEETTKAQSEVLKGMTWYGTNQLNTSWAYTV